MINVFYSQRVILHGSARVASFFSGGGGGIETCALVFVSRNNRKKFAPCRCLDGHV